MNGLRDKMASGQAVYGIWIVAAWPETAELAAILGYDFVIFDLEHGQGGPDDAVQAMRALNGSDTECVVRIPSIDHVKIKRHLDAGARSLMIPMVSSAEEAAFCASHSQYPPRGQRGYAANGIRASGYGTNPDYAAEIADDLCLIVQIETAQGVDEVEAIAATPGIDMLFVGPADLTGAYGATGDQANPAYRQAVDRVEAAARNHGKLLGTVPTPARPAADLRGAGYGMLAAPCDVILLREAMENALAEMRR